MKFARALAVLTLAVLLAANSAQAADAKLEAEVKEAIELFKKSDSGIADFFKKSAGYAVFPRVAKGAMGVGAARGTGQLFQKDQPTGETTLTQVTIGFQLGGQVYSEVIFFEEKQHLDDFKNGHFELSAQASAVAAAEGVSKNAKYTHGTAIFTIAKGGLMYEASVGGQKFKYKPYK